jgi:hypothetical protein
MYRLLVYLLFISCSLIGQNLNHLDSLNKRSRCFRDGNSNYQFNIIDLVCEKLVDKSDLHHITDYSLLQNLKVVKRNRNELSLYDTLNTSETVEVKIKTRVFIPDDHEITYLSYGPVDSVDGQEAYFGDSIPIYPFHEFKEFVIKINGNELLIPRDAYANLFDAHILNATSNWDFGVNFYYDNETELLHLYLEGGCVSGTYFSKLIFNKDGFVKKYVLDYYYLSTYGCFGRSFTGF